MTTPVFVTTWKFGVAAAHVGIEQLRQGASALDAIEAAANVTEEDPNVNSVGRGGIPNADGEIELDAAIMDGPTHAAGAVAGLIDIPRPISVARLVMERTPHVMLVGQNAQKFALANGFELDDLQTETTRKSYAKWLQEKQASDVSHFEPPAKNDKGKNAELADPEYLNTHTGNTPATPIYTPDDHDTIGLCALDQYGNLAVGCTTSGMAWKVPGRVGDSPIIGSGLYVDNEIGGAAGTGHGDEMMKANVSYRVVMLMEQGRTPTEACVETLRYLMKKRPPEQHNNYGAALIAVRKDGMYGGAATASGFKSPDRLWHWASAVGTASGTGAPLDVPDVTLHEGIYVTPSVTLANLLGS